MGRHRHPLRLDLSEEGVLRLGDSQAVVSSDGSGRDGERVEFDTEDDLTSVCVQHELDHLMGKVFVEYLSPLKRDRIKTKMLKKTRDEQSKR